MTAQRSRLRLAASCLIAAALAACGSDHVDGPDPPYGEAVIDPVERPLVPDDAPDGLSLRTVARGSDLDDIATAWLAVFGDPDAEDPLSGPVLGVTAQEGSETGPSLFWGDGPARSTQVQGMRGEIGTGDTTTWVAWGLPDDDQEGDDAAVFGRDLPVDDLQAVAEAVEVRMDDTYTREHERPTIEVPAEVVPEGLQLLAEGPVSLADFMLGGPDLQGAARLSWRGADEAVVTLQAAADDPALALLLRFAVDDPGGTAVRNRQAALGPPITRRIPPPQPVPTYTTWREDGLVLLVHSSGIDRDTVASLVAGLRPAEDGDWERLADQARESPPELMAPASATQAGTFDAGRWALGYQRSGDGFIVDTTIELIDGGAGSGSSSTWPTKLTVGVEHVEQGTLVHGVVPAGAERVRVDFADGPAWEPELEALDPSWPEQFFARWYDEQVEVVSVAAYDADDNLIAEASQEPPPANLRSLGSYWFTAE